MCTYRVELHAIFFICYFDSYAPKEIVDAIYSNVPGAEFNNQLNRWVVPCSYEIDMALQFG